MRCYLFFLFLLSFSGFTMAQSHSPQIEINPIVRWDYYPRFSYTTNTITTNEVKIHGTSWGVNVAYKFPLLESIFLKAGIGYYKYSFQNIENNNSSYGKSDQRVINYPSLYDIIFTTDKYWYNTLVLNAGVEKILTLEKAFQLVCALNFSNYYTTSQHYHIPYNFPNPENNDYTRKVSRYFGFSADIRTGITKQMGRIWVGPSVIVPVFDLWKQDRIFPQEEDNKTRSKWLGGLGAGLIFNYSLRKP